MLGQRLYMLYGCHVIMCYGYELRKVSNENYDGIWETGRERGTAF